MKHKKFTRFIAGALAVALVPTFGMIGCKRDEGPNPAAPENTDAYDIPQDYYRTYYEVFVRSFADGNGDGIGDIRGLINNLDYLNDGDDSTTEDLGINGLWLMPVNSSPSYHKYDVSDYYDIDDEYGTLEDFDELVEECDKRGIWLQMDLVLNHSSSDHPWFKAALKEAQSGVRPENSEYMKRYCFYEKGTEPNIGKAKYADAPNSNYKYLCNFSTNMPDLNLDLDDYDPTCGANIVFEEITKIVDFWLERGVHSFRLDAAPWACAYDTNYNEANELFWTRFNDYCDEKGAEVFGKPDDGIARYCYNVAEVWAGKQTILDFYKTKMTSFNYSLGGESTGDGFAGVSNERRSAYWLANELQFLQTSALANDPNAIMSNFISNHDNNRSAGYFNYDPVRIKKAAGLYLLAPGNPYIYYGEEIGAAGSGKDENKRLPFNWGDSSKGATSAPKGADYAGSQELGTWKSQNRDKNSILTYYRNAIKLRNRFPEIARGNIVAYALDENSKLGVQAEIAAANEGKQLYQVNSLNDTVIAYTLTWGEKSVLIVQNVGKAATVDLSAFNGYEVVGTLDAQGDGSIAQDGSSLEMSSGTVAVLKKSA